MAILCDAEVHFCRVAFCVKGIKSRQNELAQTRSGPEDGEQAGPNSGVESTSRSKAGRKDSSISSVKGGRSSFGGCANFA